MPLLSNTGNIGDDFLPAENTFLQFGYRHISLLGSKIFAEQTVLNYFTAIVIGKTGVGYGTDERFAKGDLVEFGDPLGLERLVPSFVPETGGTGFFISVAMLGGY